MPLFFLCLSSCSIIHSRVRLFCCTPSPAVSLSLYLYSQERVRSQYVSFSFYFSSPPIVARVPQSCSTKHCDRRMNCKSEEGKKNSAVLSDFLVWFCICCDHHAWVNSWIATTEGCKARWYFVHFNNHFISKPPPWSHLTVRGTATFNSFSIPPVIICSLWFPPSRPQGGEEKCKETLEMTHQTLYSHQPASLIR